MLDMQKYVPKYWTVETLPWDQLQPEKVDPELLKIIKAASLVEYNAQAYAEYLHRVFHDDDVSRDKFHYWAIEEVQHGKALGVWAEAVDSSWNHEKAMARFREGYTPEHFIDNSKESVRGSRSGEMVARCMVETGTSSYYTSLGEATQEPVLKQICKNIAGDEFRHYKTFYDILNKYLPQEGLTRLQRLKIALGRIMETEDDELSYAYYAANAPEGAAYDRKTYNRAYMRRAGSYYHPDALKRAVSMIFKAAGYRPHTLPYTMATKFAWWRMQVQAKQREKIAA